MHGPRNVGGLNEVDKLGGADELVEQITELSFIANTIVVCRAELHNSQASNDTYCS